MTKLVLLTAALLVAASGSAMAADLSIPPAAPIEAPAPTSAWDGPYIGVFAGYGWGTVNVDPTSVGTPPGSYTDQGFLLGVQAGYNFHVSDNIVAGIAGDIAWDNMSGSAIIGNADVSNDRRWTGSITGRLGYDAGAFLPYVLAGVAFLNNDATVTDGGITGTANVTHAGWTVGAGVEFALAANLTTDVEYRYTSYGTQDYTSPAFLGAAIPASLADNSLRIGLNYHF